MFLFIFLQFLNKAQYFKEKSIFLKMDKKNHLKHIACHLVLKLF